MFTLIEKNIYPEIKTILQAVAENKALEPKLAQDYTDVLFKSAVVHNNRTYIHGIFSLLLYAIEQGKLKSTQSILQVQGSDPNVTEIISSNTALMVNLTKIVKKQDKETQNKILIELLNHPSINLLLGSVFIKESPLQTVAAFGDENLELLKKFINKNNLIKDIYHSSPLFVAIEEEQYQTVNEILATSAGQALALEPRSDGPYALDMAAQYLTDLEKGKVIITQLLALMPIDTYEISNSLYNCAANKNLSCRLEFMKILLQAGANPNGKSIQSDVPLIAQLGYALNEAMKKNQRAEAGNLRNIILLLLEYQADIFVMVEKDLSLINCLCGIKPYGKIVVDLFEKFYKDQDEMLEKITASIQPEKTPKIAQAVVDQFYQASQMENSSAQQATLLNLWNTAGAQRNALGLQVRFTVFIKMIERLKYGALEIDGIQTLINVFKKKRDLTQYHGGNINFILYREYLTSAIFSLRDESDLPTLEQSFEYLHEFSEAIINCTDNDNAILLEFNDLLQRLIHLGLQYQEFSPRLIACFGKFLTRFRGDKIALSNTSKLDIYQLQLLHAYQTDDLVKFDHHYQAVIQLLPKNHVILRQYAYWKTKLIFNQAQKIDATQIDNHLILTLQQSLSDLKTDHAIFPKEAFDQFECILNVIGKRKKRAEKGLKREAKLAGYASVVEPQHLPPPLSPQPAGPSVSEDNVNNNNNNNNNLERLEQDQHEQAQAQDLQINIDLSAALPFAPVKGKREQHDYVTIRDRTLNYTKKQLMDAETEGEKSPTPLYQEAQIREIFKDFLHPGEILKSFTEDDKVQGICWVVCRPPAKDLTEKQQETFVDEFKKNETANFCCKNGIYRLKPAGDLRLHGQVVRAKPERCYLVILDQVWKHGDKFTRRDDIHVKPNQPSASSKSMFK